MEGNPINKYEVTLVDTSRHGLIEKILRWGKEGATVQKESLPRFNRIPYTVKLDLYTEERLKTFGKFQEYTLLPIHLIYSQRDFRDMAITDMQDIGRMYGVTGREKARLGKEILAAQEKYLKENFPEKKEVPKQQPKQEAKQEDVKEPDPAVEESTTVEGEPVEEDDASKEAPKEAPAKKKGGKGKGKK